MSNKKRTICKIFGHDWAYKDYVNRMQPDGSAYAYSQSRRCGRCNKKEITSNNDEPTWEEFITGTSYVNQIKQVL
jgi:hypothetical protein